MKTPIDDPDFIEFPVTEDEIAFAFYAGILIGLIFGVLLMLVIHLIL